MDRLSITIPVQLLADLLQDIKGLTDDVVDFCDYPGLRNFLIQYSVLIKALRGEDQ